MGIKCSCGANKDDCIDCMNEAINDLQAENVILRAALEGIAGLTNCIWSNKKAKKTLNSTPQTAKIQAVLKAAKNTLDENMHLVDGDQCTLFELREAFKAIGE